MPSFAPFAGLRYDPTRVDPAAVTAPPYDVLDEDDRTALCHRHPDNVVCVDLPRAPDGGDAYAGADETFRRWRREGLVVQDPAMLYVYRMSRPDEPGRTASTTGVLGALALSPPGEGGILPHEHTTPKARSDRLDLLRATRVNLSPIWGLSPAAGLTDLLPTDGEPLADFVDDEGIRHQLWPVADDEAVAAICATVSAEPVVIADGHHRYETSLAYRDEQRAAHGTDDGAAATLVWIVGLVEDELRVGPIHRVVHDLPPGTDLAAALTGRFTVEPVDRDEAVAWVLEGEGPAVVAADGAARLVARPDAFAGVADLDSARVDAALGDVDGLTVTYQHGVGNVTRRVDDGDVDAGVLLRPATVAQILDIARGGERMPPKTTFFFPKPRTGMVFRALD